MSDDPRDVQPFSNAVERIKQEANLPSAKSDFDIARTNVHAVIQTGLNALDKLEDIADQSQHPRAYEVMANLMKTILDANKDLLELQKAIRQIEVPTNNTTNEHKTVNNTMVLTTNDLQAMIAEMHKKQ